MTFGRSHQRCWPTSGPPTAPSFVPTLASLSPAARDVSGWLRPRCRGRRSHRAAGRSTGRRCRPPPTDAAPVGHHRLGDPVEQVRRRTAARGELSGVMSSNDSCRSLPLHSGAVGGRAGASTAAQAARDEGGDRPVRRRRRTGSRGRWSGTCTQPTTAPADPEPPSCWRAFQPRPQVSVHRGPFQG